MSPIVRPGREHHGVGQLYAANTFIARGQERRALTDRLHPVFCNTPMFLSSPAKGNLTFPYFGATESVRPLFQKLTARHAGSPESNLSTFQSDFAIIS